MNATTLDKIATVQKAVLAQWIRVQMVITVSAAGSRAGRVLLHLACSCADHQFKWHLHGIVREFSAYLAPTN